MQLLLTIAVAFVAVNCAQAAVRGKRIYTYEQPDGDIEQIKEQVRHPGVLRNALKRTATTKWDNLEDSQGNYVVPYIIDPEGTKYTDDEHKVILGAMKAIEENTCIRYKKRTNEEDYLRIQNSYGDGCYTFVGRRDGSNVLQLQASSDGTCMIHDIVIHELLHSLGLWHEQMRYDRDDYIKIHYENIATNAESQFRLVGTEKSTTYGEPYDYNSVMHYPKGAFAKKRGLITMETKDKKFLDVIGNAKTASPADYRKICKVYGCKQCNGGGGGSPALPGPSTTPPTSSGNCVDKGTWCTQAFCDNKNYMDVTKKRLCPKTCNMC